MAKKKTKWTIWTLEEKVNAIEEKKLIKKYMEMIKKHGSEWLKGKG